MNRTMSSPSPARDSERPTILTDPVRLRLDLIEVLHERYGVSGGTSKWKYLRKKYLWKLVVGGSRAFKRLLDIAISASMLVLLTPLFFVISGLIRLTDGGPALFWQMRVGQWGQEFRFPKFRSMVINAEALKDKLLAQNQHASGITFKMKRDPRVTWIGRILRATSLDELPQFWCVLKGDMSLVGPRPPVPREVALYSLRDGRRLDVKPGLTCIWQVSGRGDIPFERQVELDIQYIESQSLWLDVVLLLKTAPAILLGKGAY
ncbi:MAG TPA: sugar transferase [Bryobacteraceae bacterium]|nr:sugar transferase [Bryobacteraceae bacterium]